MNQPFYLLLSSDYTLTVNRISQQPIAIGFSSLAMYSLQFSQNTAASVSILDSSQSIVLSQTVRSVCNDEDLVLHDAFVSQNGLELIALFQITDSQNNLCPSQEMGIIVTFVGNTSTSCTLQYNSTVFSYNYGCHLALPSGTCDFVE